MRSPEQRHEAYVPFEEVEIALEAHSQETLNYDGAMFILEVSKDPQDNSIEDGKLITQGGDVFDIPTEEDTVVLQAQKDIADQKLRAAIGLPEEIDVDGFSGVAHQVTQVRRLNARLQKINPHRQGEPDSIDLYWHGSIKLDFPLKPIKQLFTNVQALARITGDTYSVWSSALVDHVCANIDPDTDIEELVEKSRSADEQILERLKINQGYTDEQKQTALERMQLAYNNTELEKA